ncbi:hypothetical protein BpHYR1_014901 [Brachionus plicatilis]|uniref:Uncharacterized protein n=1 Tax=Brachionus plicatilis TaxID=10195 RepID=A0A3M7R903_BRAPC|nr:hypothetical protein BpHYR1_014901 [Brachionus plicatilis]
MPSKFTRLYLDIRVLGLGPYVYYCPSIIDTFINGRAWDQMAQGFYSKSLFKNQIMNLITRTAKINSIELRKIDGNI